MSINYNFQKSIYDFSATIAYSSPKIGEIDPLTGLYHGMIGYIQRDETHSMAQFVRPDSTPNEPGYFITFSGFFDAPKMLSYESNRESFVLKDILYFLDSYNSDIWLYLFYCLISCTIIFYTICKILYPESRSFYSNIRKIVNIYGIISC